MTKLRRPWTEKEESDLLKWSSEGASVMLMSARLKRSMMAVNARLSIVRHREKSKPPEQIPLPVASAQPEILEGPR